MPKNICKNCKSEKIKKFFYFDKESAEFFKCLECGLIWLDEAKWPSDMKDHYSSIYYGESYVGRSNLAEAFGYRFKMIDKYMSAPGKILEIGAASGDFLNMLKERGYDVYGVELSQRATAKAKENYGLDVFCGKLEDANFKDGFFDYAVMYHVLEHVPEPVKMLSEINRVLKLGGVLLLEVPDPKSLDAKISRHLLFSILDYPHHIYAFPRKTLKNIALKSGFSVLYVENSFSFWMSEILKKIKSKIYRHNKKNSFLKTDTQSGAEEKKEDFNKKIRRSPMVLRIGKKIFPGMKLTMILKNETNIHI